VDLKDAYFQILLDDESRKICSFRCPGLGAYRYRTLAFGLHNAAQYLTRVMDKVLRIEMEFYVFYYHDDIIVATDNFDLHLKYLNVVAEK
jgi:Reverse transcriptase (RNA-dependent DNA polymerase)